MDCSEFRRNLDACIDGEIDGAIEAQMNAHAANCETCQREREAAEQLRDILSHMDDSIAVPLPAQAAWRAAVRTEARRKRTKWIWSAAGAVAAVCAVTIGVSAMLSGGGIPMDSDAQLLAKTAQTGYVVEADGVSEQAVLESTDAANGNGGRAVSIEYAELPVFAEDAQTAYGYVQDIATEYGAVIEREAEEAEEKKLYVLVPEENVTDFVSAVSHVGADAQELNAPVQSRMGMAGICVVIAQNG